MGQQNQRKRQLLLADELQHRIGIRARIQRRRFTRLRIEYDIRVDRHVAKRCGKGRKAVERAGVVRVPGILGAGHQRVRAQIERHRQLADDNFINRTRRAWQARLQFTEAFRRNTGPSRQFPCR